MGTVTTYVSPNAMLIPNVEVTDEFTDAVKGLEDAIVRRPLGGLHALADTYASLKIVTSDLIEGQSDSTVLATANFIIQSISHTAQERSQTVHTFSEDRVFFYGHAIDTIQVDAMLVENETFQWLQEWYKNYKAQISGTAALGQGKNQKVKLSCEDRTYSGFITDMSMVRTSQDRHGVQMRFTMLVAETGFTRDVLKKATVLKQTGSDEGAFATINRRLEGAANSKGAIRATPEELLFGVSSTVKYTSENKVLADAFPEEFMRQRRVNEVPVTPQNIRSFLKEEKLRFTWDFIPLFDFTQTTKAERTNALNTLIRTQAAAQKKLEASRTAFMKKYTTESYVSTSAPTAMQRIAYAAVGVVISSTQAAAEIGLREAGLSRGGAMDGYVPFRDDAAILKSAAEGVAKDFGPIEAPSE